MVSSIKSAIHKRIKTALKPTLVKAEKNIPVVNLEQRNINNLKVILNREQLLELMPKNCIAAEIGVDEGKFTEQIVKIMHPEKLHLVDVWGDADRFHDGLKNMVANKFKSQIEAGSVEMNVGLSTNIIPTFPDNYFDWAFIDTDHSYALTAKELNLIKNKMKPGGIIAGHDYTFCNWVDQVRYGVIEAVHEFCVKEGWELIYITIETGPYRTFAIRKL